MAAENDGAPLPEVLTKAPELPQGLYATWKAFAMLSRSRSYNFGGSNPIQIAEILAYFEMFGITDFEDRETMLYLIKELDSEYLKDEAARRPKK